jgi:hypothetical protein
MSAYIVWRGRTVPVKGLYTLACLLQFVGRCRRQASSSTLPLMRGSLASKQSGSRRRHHKKPSRSPATLGPGNQDDRRAGLSDLTWVISNLGPYLSCNLTRVIRELYHTLQENVIHSSGFLNSSVPMNIFKLYLSVLTRNWWIYGGAGLMVWAHLYSSVNHWIYAGSGNGTFPFSPFSARALSFISFATPRASLCSRCHRCHSLLMPPLPPPRHTVARPPPHAALPQPRSHPEPGPPPARRYFLFLCF